MTDAVAQADKAQTFPCAQCGAALAFDPDSGRLLCAHCGHSQPIPAPSEAERGAALKEIDYAAALRDPIAAADVEERQAIKCTACGAETMFSETTRASRCPFCAAPLVADPGLRRQFRPKALSPFLIGEKDARGRLKRWLKGLWFAPGDLTKLARTGEGFSGIYLPYWTFDADTRSRYTGQRGDAYYETVTRTVLRDGKNERVTQQVRKIRWRPASGRVARDFDDVLATGSRALPDKLSRQLDRGGWDLSTLIPYRAEHMAGFLAEAYDVDLEEGFVAARATMDAQIARDVRADIGGDEQRIHQIDTDISDVTFKHILLPVWIAAYRYRDKPYRVLVNGRTGQIAGERPYSAWKIAIAVILALLTAGAIIAILSLAEG